MSEKLYLSAQGLLEDAFRLGAMVLKSGFEPSFITAIWRGRGVGDPYCCFALVRMLSAGAAGTREANIKLALIYFDF